MERAIRAMTQSSSGSAQWRTAHNFHLGITFLLELSAAAGCLPLGFHRGKLSLGDGMLADPRWFAFESCLADFRGRRVAAGGEAC
jgi:hypothetical protein